MGEAPGSVAGEVESDSEEPRLKAPPRIEPCTRAEHPQECFLKQVLRFCGVAAEPEKKSIERSAIPGEKSPRCSFIAGKHEPGHFLIRGDVITHRIIVDKKDAMPQDVPSAASSGPLGGSVVFFLRDWR